MIQIGTKLNVADNTGAKIVECFKLLGATKVRFGRIGDVIIGSVKDATATAIAPMHSIVHTVIVRQKKEMRRKDGSYIRFDDNACVILEDKTSKKIKGSRIFGPIARELKERGFAKIASLAPEVV